jgi:hypothetical protein
MKRHPENALRFYGLERLTWYEAPGASAGQ